MNRIVHSYSNDRQRLHSIFNGDLGHTVTSSGRATVLLVCPWICGKRIMTRFALIEIDVHTRLCETGEQRTVKDRAAVAAGAHSSAWQEKSGKTLI